jgi:pyruvate/2-oxoglutarate/acetoin dehydrogenase E1 component
MLYDVVGEVPDQSYTLPFAEARVVKDGPDATIFALGQMVQFSEKASQLLAEKGINVSVVDLRTTSPIDEDTIIEFTEQTGRVVIVDESYPRCGFAADIAAFISSEAFEHLKAPIRRVTPPHTPVPYSPALEKLFLPNPERIFDAVLEVCNFRQD